MRFHFWKPFGCTSSFNVRNRELLDAVSGSAEPHAVIAANVVRHHWDVADPVKNVVTSPIEQKEEKDRGHCAKASFKS